MKEYDFCVLFHPDLEMNIDPALNKVKKIIESNDGKILKEESEGKKRLAYTINGQDFAIYFYFRISVPAIAPAKISSAMNITDEALRYLIVKAEDHKVKPESRRKAKVSEETETPEEVQE